MNQQTLIEVEDESAFFLPSEQVRKRYTSAQVQGIEWKRSAVLLLVGYGCPTETIARELQMNVRTVNAIVSQDGGKVAGFRKEYAAGLLKLGGESFALASTKAHEASYLQLMTGGGIATDKAIALSQMGECGEEKSLKERPDHALVCAELRRLMDRPTEPGQDEPSEAPRDAIAPNNGQNHAIVAAVLQPQGSDRPPAAPLGEGGGSPRPRRRPR